MSVGDGEEEGGCDEGSEGALSVAGSGVAAALERSGMSDEKSS